jgi:hypothetical protein
MEAFRPEDAEWFFGRDRLIAELTSRLDQRLRRGGGPLVVVAPSGAGKSSLLQAGLIPKLEQGALPGSHHWPGLRMTPTDRPVTALAEAIAVVTGEPTDEVAQQITHDPDRCIESLRAALRGRQGEATSAGVRLVLIVDQLEELFTMCSDERERHRFLHLISRLTDPGRAGQDPVALAVYGLRADFYTHCAGYPCTRLSASGCGSTRGWWTCFCVTLAELLTARPIPLSIGTRRVVFRCWRTRCGRPGYSATATR